MVVPRQGCITVKCQRHLLAAARYGTIDIVPYNAVNGRIVTHACLGAIHIKLPIFFVGSLPCTRYNPASYPIGKQMQRLTGYLFIQFKKSLDQNGI